jgi:MOSC domain-containing protein YiiM
MADEEACIGDRYRIGTAVFEVMRCGAIRNS